MLTVERLWWVNAPQERLTTNANPLLNPCFLQVLLVLTFCRHHDNLSQGEGQEGIFEKIEKLAEFIFFSG